VRDELEVIVSDPLVYVFLSTGEEVIQHDNLVTLKHELINEMGSDEASPSSDEDSEPLSFWQGGDLLLHSVACYLT
jgi:hypothetical protein